MEGPETAESELPAAYYLLNLRLVRLTEDHYLHSDGSISSPKPTGTHSLHLSIGFHFHPNLFVSEEMVSTLWQNTGSSASILGIALMTLGWMAEQQRS